MPTIIGHHNITKGAKHWLTSPKRKELFAPLGVTNIRTFVDPQNPTRVAVQMDVPDMDAFKATMQTKAAADAMASDGVVPLARALHFLVHNHPRGAGHMEAATIVMPGPIGSGSTDPHSPGMMAADRVRYSEYPLFLRSDHLRS